MLIFLIDNLDIILPFILILSVLITNKFKIEKDYIFYFILSQFVLNLLAGIIGHFFTNNLYVYYFNCLFSFIFISLHFLRILHSPNKSYIIKGLMIIYILFFFLNLIFWEGLFSFNSNSSGLASFIVVVYCFIYYLERLLRPQTESILKVQSFWFTNGLLTYYAGNFFIFITYHKLTDSLVSNLGLIWKVHNLIFLILFIYFFIGILCKRSPKK